MMYKKIFSVAVLISSLASFSQAFDTPSKISASLLNTEPYKHTGLFFVTTNTSNVWLGSGYLVNQRVLVSAAHVAYDSDNLTWYSNQYFALAYNQSINNLASASVPMTGIMHLAAYSSAKADKNTKAAFNADILTSYSVSDISSTHGSYTIRRVNEQCLIAEEWQALLLGYPMDDTYIPSNDQGKMFQTGPSNWLVIDVDADNDGAILSDAYGTVYAEYACRGGLEVYSGNSGGPLMIYDADDGRYEEAGVVTASSSTGSDSIAYFRIIDEAAEGLIKSAITASGTSNYLTPPTINAQGSDYQNLIAWNDSALGETAWQIRRNDGSAWKIIGTSNAGTNFYQDPSAEHGITYQYAVRAIHTLGNSSVNYGPWSKRAEATKGSYNTTLADAFSAPYLCVTSGGDAPFHASNSGTEVYSGKVLNQQESYLDITVNGPGTLTFSWASSCEDTYLNSDSIPTVADYLSVSLDGTEKSKIYGVTSYAGYSLSVTGTGNHTVRFTYNKDYYSAEGNDRGEIKNLSYYGSSSSEAVQGGIVTSGNWRYSLIFGTYYNYGNQWVYSAGLEFIYMYPQTSITEWTSHHAQWMYLNDPAFGWCYTNMDSYPWIWSLDKGWMYYMHDGWFWVVNSDQFEQINTGKTAKVE